MVFRRCPQCGSTTDSKYGFCIKCGYEFQKIDPSQHTCPLCGFSNPDEADFCVKCGTPIVLKNLDENINTVEPKIIIKKEIAGTTSNGMSRMTKWLIIFGYLFSVLGGLLGLIIAIYLITRKEPDVKKHGLIQLAIFGFYILLIAVLLATGVIPMEALTNYQQLLTGNMTLP